MPARSPFTNFANAILTFSVDSVGSGSDTKGNPLIVKEPLIITALLSEASGGGRKGKGKTGQGLTPLAGSDAFVTAVSGYLVSPLSLPATISPNAKATVQWGRKTGEFTLEPSIANPYIQAMGIDIVNKIQGVIRWKG